jgi:hypothetical protein
LIGLFEDVAQRFTHASDAVGKEEYEVNEGREDRRKDGKFARRRHVALFRGIALLFRGWGFCFAVLVIVCQVAALRQRNRPQLMHVAQKRAAALG